MPADQFDAVVVGLGAAGTWAAKVLTERGLRVAALDAGRRLTEKDLPLEIGHASYGSRLFVKNRGVQSRSVSFHPEIHHLYVDDRAHPYSTRGGDPFLWIRGRQVGGRLHTWARMALRLSEEDFRRAEIDGQGASWPIGYSDLAGFYDQIETFHGLRGGRDGIPSLPDGQISEPGDFGEAAALFRQKIEARWPERRVILPRVLGQEITPIPSPLQQAIDTGKLRLLPDAPVSRVLLNTAGDQAVGVEVVDPKTRQRSQLFGDRIFLCASAIESVRILLNSRCDQHPHGVGNSHDQLGRHLMDHNFVVATGPAGDAYRGLNSNRPLGRASPLDLSADLDFYIPNYCDTLKDRGFARGFGLQGMLTPNRWGMAAFGEMLPHAENRVTLTDTADTHGIPTVNIAMRRRDNDWRMIKAQKRHLHELAEAAGLPLRMPMPTLLRPLLWKAVGPEVGVMHLGLAIHESGGARMGTAPEDSVVNDHNQLHDVPNLFVTDGACLPSTGCQNPTLTIMALTVRACEFAARL